MKSTGYLVSGLERFDLFKVFSVGSVGVVKGGLELANVGLVLLLNAGDFGLVTGLNLDKGALQLFDGALSTLPVSIKKMPVVINCFRDTR